jgi:predicted transcriptional regulator
MPAKPKTALRETVNIRFPVHIDKQIARVARLTKRTKSAVIVGVVAEHLAWRIPQQEDLKKGLAEADAGKFVSHDVVVGKLRKLIKKHDR